MSPPQGFRHAVALMLARSIRAIPADAPPDIVTTALERLAGDLAGLADDMRAAPEWAEWLLAEFTRTLDQIPHRFDRAAATGAAAAIFDDLHGRSPAVEPRDVFLVYVPEDRLPVAGPLAVELTKRRISVALSAYEVASSHELALAVQHGLAHHRVGVVLWTRSFERRGWEWRAPATERLRVAHVFDTDAAAELASWVRLQSVGNIAK